MKLFFKYNHVNLLRKLKNTPIFIHFYKCQILLFILNICYIFKKCKEYKLIYLDPKN